MAEFTGERVIPGEVDQDLWNEHLARYFFAARLSRHRRVLDLACGTGYGTAELACTASSAVGLDISEDAVDHARQKFARANTRFLRASCTQVPFADHSFDLVTAFEVIEHLEDWRLLLDEARRVLAPGGQFLVSTPNKSYYAESRRMDGANPFHVHEFEFEEFRQALAEVFPHVSLFVQNHSYGVAFQPIAGGSSLDARLEASEVRPQDGHFFLAVCAATPLTGAPTFVYLPTTANVLREREHHIARLEQELAQKEEWLKQAQQAHQALLELHAKLKDDLEARNRWAEQLNRDLQASGDRVAALQEELAAEQVAAKETIAAYNLKIADLEQDAAAKARWAQETETRLSAELEAKCQELARCVDLLHEAERTVEERTKWAQSLDRQRKDLEAQVSMVQASRWHRMGRRLGFGPEVGKQ